MLRRELMIEGVPDGLDDTVVLWGIEDIDEIVLFVRMNLVWFQEIMRFAAGIASAYTIRRVLSIIDH
jgi:hypothetical protein